MGINRSASVKRFYLVIATSLALLVVSESSSQEAPLLSETKVVADQKSDLRPLRGKWYIQEAEPAVYFYKDGDRFVDLFSYHRRDSNQDGIENIRIRHDEKFLIVESQGYPNHPTAIFPNSQNPNSIVPQSFTFRFPLEPKLSGEIRAVPMGPIGMALNGVVFFNPFEAGGQNAVEGYSEIWLDSCCGHPQQHGVYHYHKIPSCVKSPFPDDGKQHSPILGFAFDGFPIYGPYDKDGVLALSLRGNASLDACNGHSDPARGYHYHVTPGRFPYIIGGYAGIVETSNNHELAHSGVGPIRDNSVRGDGTNPNAILSVKPTKLARGAVCQVSINLKESGLAPEIKGSIPSWVQFGPYEAKEVRRRGNVILARIDVPADASAGLLLDCHVEFDSLSTRGPIVIKKNEVLRIVE